MADATTPPPPSPPPTLKTPLESPTPSSSPIPRPQLTAEQETKYSSLLSSVQSITDIPCGKKPQLSGPLTDRERLWLSRECILRYLRATNWSVKVSHQRLVDTLSWRREYGLEDFTADYVSPEQETGKQFIVGFDKQARPCHYLNPGRQNTEHSPRQIHNLFYMMERTMDMMPTGVEKLDFMVNFQPSKHVQNTSVPISIAREVLNILQGHYPERLGTIFIINVPWIVWGFFKLIKPLMHPVTREKLKFNEDASAYVPAEQLWKADWNGELDFEYDHAVYWPALNDLCRRRREARLARWIAAGSHIGESEDYLAGGTDLSVSGFKYAPAQTSASSQTGVVDMDPAREKLAAASLPDDNIDVAAA